jgi:hypothetical protein
MISGFNADAWCRNSMRSPEAVERPTLCGSASFVRFVAVNFSHVLLLSDLIQKTHSASIIAGPNAYAAEDKRKGQKIIEIDCRGLEFTEFKPDVCV